MSADTGMAVPETKRRIVRWWVLVMTLALGGMAARMFFLALAALETERNDYDLSREDGKSRFIATKRWVMVAPAGSNIRQRAQVAWMNFQRRYGRKKPMTWSFPPSPVRPCSVDGLLNQCMEITGTQYMIAVEIAGGIDFGTTNTFTGPQWVAAFERAIETSQAVSCYDYGKKRWFMDRLLVIRERPGLMKIIPLSKLADYQRAGLVGKAIPSRQ